MDALDVLDIFEDEVSLAKEMVQNILFAGVEQTNVLLWTVYWLSRTETIVLEMEE